MADVSRPLYPGRTPKSLPEISQINRGTAEGLSVPSLLIAYAKELDETGFAKAADTIYRFEHGLLNYRAFPPQHWKKIRTTNLLERVHKEVKRRTKKVGAFPNEESLLRLAVSVLIDINEEWILGNRYLSVKITAT